MRLWRPRRRISSTSSADPMERFESRSCGETEALGAKLAERLEPGDVVVVSGEVGAGKTTLIRGACRALGVEGPVTSPTFTIGRRYLGGRLPVSHLDLYRVRSLEDEDPALLDDYLGPDGVAFIEWPAAAEPRLARRALEVRLRHKGGDSREIELGLQ
jgi:tRNA threonylcarbamoyladenosine biosynthesis protein TsaE